MSFPSFAHQIVQLGAKHNRADFHSGSEPLDRYLRERANQDFKRYVATPFVLYDADAERIAGYYTLAATGIQFDDLPAAMQKKLPRYPIVPAILLGRLAVDRRYQGQGLGAFLLVEDDAARSFYEYHNFVSLAEQPLRLFLPMTLIARQFS
jgi:GNAT superfamily N-acetyltransferase